MAANSKCVQAIAGFGKQFVLKIRSRDPTSSASAFASRRSTHTDVYNKNLDDQVSPSAVPDEVIKPESDKYWAPHPQTGVFGPASEYNANSNPAEGGGLETPPADGSVLRETAWFRPTSLEDLEKSSHS